MTKNRRHKAEVRAVQAATGVAYMEARRRTLAEVMNAHPLLNSFGIGVFSPWRKTAEQRRVELAAGREGLAGREAQVLSVVEWLRENIAPIKTPKYGSYGLKHVMERANRRYVTNGEFIAGALMLGYPYKYTPPNVLFGMSARDIKRVDAAARQAR